MAYYTLDQVDATLAKWQTAANEIAEGKSYLIGDRSLSLADAREVQDQINYWTTIRNQIVARQSGKKRKLGRKATFVV